MVTSRLELSMQLMYNKFFGSYNRVVLTVDLESRWDMHASGSNFTCRED